ncbi:MAG: hypothetical protein V2A64_06225 [Candidatus Omnitrophota bacterium]
MIRQTINKTIRMGREKGQAAVELAVFGSLILIALSVLLTYGQRLEIQQQLKMEAFRRALTKAYEKNSSVSYTIRKDARFFNLFGGYREGQSSSVGASASVMWVKGNPGAMDTDGNSYYAFYQINDTMIGDVENGLQRYEKKVFTQTGKDVEIKSPVSIWKEEVNKQTDYKSHSTRTEDSEGITIDGGKDDKTTLKETVTTTFYTRFDKSKNDPRAPVGTIPPDYVYQGSDYKNDKIIAYAPESQGAYAREDNRVDYSKDKTGTTITYDEKNWTVNHDSSNLNPLPCGERE